LDGVWLNRLFHRIPAYYGSRREIADVCLPGVHFGVEPYG
jgi:hypothetical protein